VQVIAAKVTAVASIERQRAGRLVAGLLAGVLVALALAACSTSAPTEGRSSTPHQESPAPGAPPVTDVPADTETQPTQHAGDSADDPALWIDTEHPERSGITATSTALGSDFPHGVFVCQDDDNTGPAS